MSNWSFIGALVVATILCLLCLFHSMRRDGFLETYQRVWFDSTYITAILISGTQACSFVTLYIVSVYLYLNSPQRGFLTYLGGYMYILVLTACIICFGGWFSAVKWYTDGNVNYQIPLAISLTRGICSSALLWGIVQLNSNTMILVMVFLHSIDAVNMVSIVWVASLIREHFFI